MAETINFNAPRLQFTTRGKSGVSTFWGPPDTIEPLSGLTNTGAHIVEYSKDGSLVAVCDAASISIHNTNSGELVQKIEHPKIQVCVFSPRNTYFLTWERLTKELTQDNLIIWDIASAQPLYKFTQKIYVPELWPSIKWFEDERFAARLVTNEVHFFADKNFRDVVHRLRLEDVSKFSLSPGEGPVKVATFVKEKKGAPGFVRIFSFPEFEAVASRSFFRAQEVDFMWNSLGNSLLIQTRTDVDKSGKSYYGESGVHFLQADGKFESNIALKKEGPVHDVAWSPLGTTFAITYGFMPAQTTLFDNRCNILADFGAGSRNTLRWSPNGRMLLIGGFGNLQGYFDIWDPKRLKKIGSGQANCAAQIEWSPDSRYVLTAVLSPRIRVDNGYKVWTYDANLVYETRVDELYEVKWRTALKDAYPDRPPSPRVYAQAKQAEVAPTAPKNVARYQHPNAAKQMATVKAHENEGPVKYRPPHARPSGSAAAEKDLPPGYEPETKTGKKNQKRRQKKKQTGGGADGQDEGDEGDEGEDDTSNATSAQNVNNSSAQSQRQQQQQQQQQQAEDPQKKLKAISKKLRQIDELKEKLASGQTLDAAALEKIKTEEALRKEMDQLSIS